MNTFKTDVRCVSCVIKQITDALEESNIPDEKIWCAIREVLEGYISGNLDDEAGILRVSPVFMSALGFEKISRITGEKDYYKDQKKNWNMAAIELFPELERIVKKDKDQLKIAVKMSLIGNLIDFGVGKVFKEIHRNVNGKYTEGLRYLIERFLEDGNFDLRSWDDFKSKVDSARSIVFIADNAGEIVLDKLLIDQLGPERTVCIFRENPIINDMTIKDLYTIGEDFLGCKIVSDGSKKKIPAFTFEYCSEEAKALFNEADMVICKGMGNFESLFGRSGEKTFFLVVTKCDVICNRLGTEKNTLFLFGNHTMDVGKYNALGLKYSMS